MHKGASVCLVKSVQQFCCFDFLVASVLEVRNIERCTKDEYSLFGSRCAAIETQIVSTSLLNRVQ